jgi:hypothetical protein
MPLTAASETTRPPLGVSLAVFEHWLSLRDDSPRPDRIPLRDQIDMLTLQAETLPWFFINQREGDRYVSRLAGTAMVQGIGFETKGRYLDEMMSPETYPERKALFDMCLDDAVCIHYRATLAAPNRDHVGFSRILFPAASSESIPVDIVCGTMVFFGNVSLSDREREMMDDGFRGILFGSYYDGAVWRRLMPTDGETPVAT